MGSWEIFDGLPFFFSGTFRVEAQTLSRSFTLDRSPRHPDLPDFIPGLLISYGVEKT